MPTTPPIEQENPASSSKTETYYAAVDGYQLISKLMRVNGESRQAALDFYRVHHPCMFSMDAEVASWKPGIFYFNPEYDFLLLGEDWSLWPAKDTLINFLYHLKTVYDPLRIGLLNLAVGTNSLIGIDLSPTEASAVPSHILSSFIETITQLQEVFFYCTPRGGRQILGWLSGGITPDTILNRSFPIMARAPTFDRIRRDPRPVNEDLKQVFVGTYDQRRTIRLWHQSLKEWGITAPQIKYHFYLAFDPFGAARAITPISNRHSANEWLKREDNEWNGVREFDDAAVTTSKTTNHFKHIKTPVGAEHENYKNEDLEKAVKPAFGFWLFPVAALSPLKEEGVPQNEGYIPKLEALLDMTEYWPELALSSLP